MSFLVATSFVPPYSHDSSHDSFFPVTKVLQFCLLGYVYQDVFFFRFMSNASNFHIRPCSCLSRPSYVFLLMSLTFLVPCSGEGERWRAGRGWVLWRDANASSTPSSPPLLCEKPFHFATVPPYRTLFCFMLRNQECADMPDEARFSRFICLNVTSSLQVHLSSVPSSPPFLCENPSTLPQFLHIVSFSVSCLTQVIFI